MLGEAAEREAQLADAAEVAEVLTEELERLQAVEGAAGSGGAAPGSDQVRAPGTLLATSPPSSVSAGS